MLRVSIVTVGLVLAGTAALALSSSTARAGELASIGSGSTTFEAQTLLRQLGFTPGRLDGYYGPHTAAAIKAFQRQEELPATGSLDARTIARLHAIPEYFRSIVDMPDSQIHATPKVDDDAREEVIQLYSAAMVEDAKTREMSVELLAELKNDRAFAALQLVLLTNSMPQIRLEAAQKLSDLGDLASLGALAYAVQHEKDATVRAAIQEKLDDAIPTEPLPEGTLASASTRQGAAADDDVEPSLLLDP